MNLMKGEEGVKTTKNPIAPLWRGRLPGQFRMENDMRLKRLYDKNPNHATPKRCHRQKPEQPFRILTEFERKLNQKIAWYARQDLLTSAPFFA